MDDDKALPVTARCAISEVQCIPQLVLADDFTFNTKLSIKCCTFVRGTSKATFTPESNPRHHPHGDRPKISNMAPKNTTFDTMNDTTQS